MPCGCFGKTKKTPKDKSGLKADLEDAPDKPLYNATGDAKVVPGAPSPGRAADNKRPEDDPDKANRRRDVVASYYSDQCELLNYKPTGSRPPSAYTSADTVPLLGTPPSPPAATSSPTPSSPSSSRSGASCRAELAMKRREFFRDLERNGSATPLSSTLPSASRLNSLNNKRPNSHPSSDVTTRSLFNGQVKVNLKSAKLPRDSKGSNLNKSIDEETSDKPPTPPPPFEGDINNSYSLPTPPASPTHLKSQITSDQLKSVHLKKTPVQEKTVILSEDELERRALQKIEIDEKDNELFSLIETSEIKSKEDIDELMDIIDSSADNTVLTEISKETVIIKPEKIQDNLDLKETEVITEVDVPSVQITTKQETVTSTPVDIQNIDLKLESQPSSVILPTLHEESSHKNMEPPSLQETLKQIPPPTTTELEDDGALIESALPDDKIAELEVSNQKLADIIEDASVAVSGNVADMETTCLEQVSNPSAPDQMDLLDQVTNEENTLSSVVNNSNISLLPQMVTSQSVEPTEFKEENTALLSMQLDPPSKTVIDKTIETTSPVLSSEELQKTMELIKTVEPTDSSQTDVYVDDQGNKVVKESTVTSTSEDGNIVVTKRTTVVTSGVVEGDDLGDIDTSNVVIQEGPIVTKVIKQTIQVDSESDIPTLTNINMLDTNVATEDFMSLPQETISETSGSVPVVVDQESLKSIIDRSNGLSIQHLASEITATLQENLKDDVTNTRKTAESPLITDVSDEISEIPELININTGHVLETGQLPHSIEQTLDDVRIPEMPEISDVTSDLLSGKNIITLNESDLQSTVAEQKLKEPSSLCQQTEDSTSSSNVDQIQHSPPPPSAPEVP